MLHSVDVTALYGDKPTIKFKVLVDADSGDDAATKANIAFAKHDPNALEGATYVYVSAIVPVSNEEADNIEWTIDATDRPKNVTNEDEINKIVEKASTRTKKK